MLARRLAQLALILTTTAFVYSVMRGPVASDLEPISTYPPTLESRLILEELTTLDETESRASAGDLAAPVSE